VELGLVLLGLALLLAAGVVRRGQRLDVPAAGDSTPEMGQE
jgi:hypothetical protein